MKTAQEEIDEKFMRLALEEAQKACSLGEVPLGCAIADFRDGTPRLVASAHNETEQRGDATSHAEMLAISKASAAVGDFRLPGMALYVTKEPCAMCAGAIVLSRISRVVWGVSDPKRGGESRFGILSSPELINRPEIVRGVLEDESLSLLQGFFRERRRRPGLV